MNLKRVQPINFQYIESNTAKKCVVYVVSRDIRIKDNHALFYAWEVANSLQLPLIVIFNLRTNIVSRIKNHYEFMLKGLIEFKNNLKNLNITLLVSIDLRAKALSEEINKLSPAQVFFDFSPLKNQIEFKNKIIPLINSKSLIIDTHNIVPVWIASDKEEYSAFTLRNKLQKKINEFLQSVPNITKLKNVYTEKLSHNFLVDFSFNDLFSKINLEYIQNYTPVVNPGELNALKEMKIFVKQNLVNYYGLKNNPVANSVSNLSAYLHFGNISSLTVANYILEYLKDFNITLDLFKKSDVKNFNDLDFNTKLKLSAEAFLEELIVRKELAENFCFYNKNYNNLLAAKPWAIKTLDLHSKDKREYIYSVNDFEKAQTHDLAWNACQTQLLQTGKIHGYLRMYWAKKIFEWSESAKVAIEITIYLNDKYSLDGLDPNGYTGILWSIAGIHDRPWFSRPIFGNIRYMNFNGLKSKFNILEYIKKWS